MIDMEEQDADLAQHAGEALTERAGLFGGPALSRKSRGWSAARPPTARGGRGRGLGWGNCARETPDASPAPAGEEGGDRRRPESGSFDCKFVMGIEIGREIFAARACAGLRKEGFRVCLAATNILGPFRAPKTKV